MRRILPVFPRAFFCLLIVTLFSVAANAQFKASLQGTVTDPAGGVVQGATVTLTNNETQRTQTATTNDEGFYRFSALSPGSYTVTAEQTGFRKSAVENYNIKAEETQGLDLTLSTGEISETVTVTGEQAQPLQTENANISATISTQEVRGLPQVGRDPYELARLTPGVFGNAARSSNGNSQRLPGVEGPGGSNTSIFQTENQVQITANGQRVSANNFQIDGVSVNSLGQGGAAVVTPNQESVKEVRVLANTYSAEDGRNSGAHVQVVSQNGTNEFHGSAFFKYNSPSLNAFNRFPTPERVEQRFRQFGGSIGGPIVKDRLFFFFSYEGVRNNNSAFRNNVVVETPEFREYVRRVRPNSLAARLFGTEGIEPRIQSVVVTPCPPGLPPGSVCQQVGSGLAIGSLNLARPTGFYYGFNPVLNGSNQSGGGLDGIPDIQFVNLFVPNLTRGDQFNTRFDYKQGENQFALSTYFTRLNNLVGSSNGRSIGDTSFKPLNSAATLTFIRPLTATAINEARFNFTRFAFNQVDSSSTANFGIPFFNIFDFDTPVRCCLNIGAERTDTNPGIFAQNTYEFSDTVTVVLGNHAVRFGGLIRREQDNNNLQGGARPLFQFSSFFNFANDAVQFESIDIDPRTGGQAIGQRYFRTGDYALFVQDDWKVRPNLTLNLGLRYEYFSPLSEKEDRLSNYLLGSSELSAGIPTGRVQVVDRLFEPDRNNFAPRLGFAYSPNFGERFGGLLNEGRAVIRGGFGIAYNRIANSVLS
ncbi:MAG: TonB-dependent receptor, partial [Pyrinomonadaceae bacterium]|nr:TonB-dependent receptor [Pyrinomonadaceae bacterium]